MSMAIWRQYSLRVSRICVVFLCLGGFCYHSAQFLNLYWTYPTVVDIQQSSPSHIEMPAITICNPIGYNYTAMCHLRPICIPNSWMKTFFQKFYCNMNPDDCVDNTIPSDQTGMSYVKFLSGTESIDDEEHEKLRVALEDYMKCSIEVNGAVSSCNLQTVLGSFYTKDLLPQYCYSLYSLWGQPDRQRERIQKGAVVRLRFSLNASGRSEVVKDYNQWGPSRNTPMSPYVQLAVHSPYFLPSPYLDGHSFKGGLAFRMRIAMDEKRLLPFPYRTNCTDYMTEWKRNGGKGPINQLGVVQQCRMRRWVERAGCVPVSVDYPHTHSICGKETVENYAGLVNDDKCIMLADHYNQPCEYLSYHSTKEQVDILVTKTRVRGNVTEELKTRIPGHDCKNFRRWRPECSLISIDLLFDRFQITKVKYNPKFERLDMFSAIGGYMGMWLGVSLVVIYDYIGAALVYAKTEVLKWRHRVRNSVLKFAPRPPGGTTPREEGAIRRIYSS